MSKLIPPNYTNSLIYCGKNLTKDFIESGLKEMSLSRLSTAKLTTKNFKQGLNFNSINDVSYSLGKLFRLLKNYVYKDKPWLVTEIDTAFMSPPGAYQSASIIIVDLQSTCLSRYLNFVNKKLTQAGIPLFLRNAPVYNRSYSNRVTIAFDTRNVSTPTEKVSASLYRILFYIPEVLKVLNTLSRKVSFSNQIYARTNRHRASTQQPISQG